MCTGSSPVVEISISDRGLQLPMDLMLPQGAVPDMHLTLQLLERI